MRVLALAAAILGVAVLLLLGLLELLQDLIGREFFREPSLPGGAADPSQEAEPD